MVEVVGSTPIAPTKPATPDRVVGPCGSPQRALELAPWEIVNSPREREVALGGR